MMFKENCSTELGNDLPVPTVLETHEILDPPMCTSNYDFTKYNIVLPSHVVPLHILCLMRDHGLLQNDSVVEVLLKHSPKPSVSGTPRLCIWVLSP